MKPVIEKPFFFPSGEHKLFGVIHLPGNSHEPGKEKTGIIFCHPFAEEKLISHRCGVNLARSLAGTGYKCMRFDFFGHGDSDGRFEDSTISTRLDNIENAARHMREEYGVSRIGLLGTRFGGTLAMLFSAAADIEFVIAISPVLKGKSYMEQCLRSNLTTQMAIHRQVLRDRTQLVEDLMQDIPVNIDGYLLRKPLYLQMIQIDLNTHSLPSRGSILLVEIVKPGLTRSSPELTQLDQRLRENRVDVTLVAVEGEQFWKDSVKYSQRQKNLEVAIATWIQERF